jgi:ABC-type sugar transport system substrate-binding protein
MTPIAQEVFKTGTKLLIIDRPIEGDTYTTFYGGDNAQCGHNAAKYIGDRLKGKGQIAILRSYVGIPIDLQRYNGFMEVLKKSYPGIKVIVEGDEYTVFYGGDNAQGGRNAAKYLGDRLKGKGQIAILRSYVGIPIDVLRYEGFMEVLKKSYPGIKVLVVGDGEFNQEAGRKAMSNILPAYPKIDAIYSQDDESAVGALTEIRSAKRKDIQFVTGMGGSKTAFALMSVRDPVYGASMSYLPTMGGRAVAMAKAMLQGKTFPKDNIEPTVVVTADNVAKYVNDGY